MPELMAEVISPHDLAEEVIERIAEYFSAGAKLVWVIYPKTRFVYVYESPQNNRILSEIDELDGVTLLPGFRVSVGSLIPA